MSIDEKSSGFERRPWGTFVVLDESPVHKVKRIEVMAHQRLSYQRHSRRAEHWVVVRGNARVTLNGVETVLSAGQSIDIPTGAAHRIENTTDEPMAFIEVQQGTYFGEDDIERLQDDYGR